MSDTLKEPTKAQIQTGYMLHKAKEQFEKYASQAVECARVAGNEAKEAGELPAVMLLDGDIGLVQETIGITRKNLGAVHKNLRRRMKRQGYREITDEDFLEFGAGGGR